MDTFVDALSRSRDLGIPRDQRTARAALRLLGGIDAGTAVVRVPPQTAKFAEVQDAETRELGDDG